MEQPRWDRREVLAGILGGLTIACVGGGEVSVDGTDETTDGTLGDTGVVPWATGGTAALVGPYAVDFDDDCAQTCELTLGPCYAESVERRDISEGVDGLPTRMAFRVVDTDCNPVAGAVVDIWHCSPAGLYSGSDAASMCTDNDSAARASRWFRGYGTTDADGAVVFDTCMPGWYPSRAVHIHLQVRVGGQSYVISQLGFPEALLEDVFSTHPVYAPHGQPDTPNRQDDILSRDLDAHLFRWRQASDGALVIWKTLVIRGTLSEPVC